MTIVSVGGGALKGTFRIPAGARGGDKFVLTLPEEYIIEHGVSTVDKFFDLNGPGGRLIGRAYHTKSNEITFELLNEANYHEDYDGTFMIGNRFDQNYWINSGRVERVNGNQYYDKTKAYYYGIVPRPNLFYNEQNPDDTVVYKNLEYKSTYYGFNGNINGCTRIFYQNAIAHYEDKGIQESYGSANKYVIEETEDSLTYEVVFNSNKEDWGNSRRYYDRLSDTIELLHGNKIGVEYPSPTSNPLFDDIEIFRAWGTVTGAYHKGSKQYLYPVNDTNDSSVYWIEGKEINVNRPYATDGGNVHFPYEVGFNVQNPSNWTIVMQMRVKKGVPIKNYYYNEGEIFTNDLSWRRINNRYSSTIGKGSADFGASAEFKVRKVREGIGEKVPITNNPARFRIWNYGLSRAELTDKNGIATFKNVPVGKFYLEEIDAPEGYVKDDKKRVIEVFPDFSVKLYIVENDDQWFHYDIKETINYDSLNVIPFDIVNAPLPSLKIQKVDGVTNEELTGAVFKLTSTRSVDGKPAYQEISGEVNGENLNFSVFEFHNLVAGDNYILEEIKTPTGYSKMPNRYFSVISFNGKVVIEETNETFTQEVTPAPVNNGVSYVTTAKNFRTNAVEFIKTDIYNTPIADTASKAKFDLYVSDKNTDGITANATSEEFVLQEGNTVSLYKVNKIGAESVTQKSLDVDSKFGYSNIPDGVYYVVETSAPEGYIVPAHPVATFVISNGSLVGENALPICIQNAKPGRFIIDKSDVENENIKLGGVEFSLYTDSACTIPYKQSGIDVKAITENDGSAKFEGLSEGVYFMKETRTKEGYKLSNDIWKIAVDSKGRTLVAKFATQSEAKRAETINALFGRFRAVDVIMASSLYESRDARDEGNIRDVRDVNNTGENTQNGVTLKQVITELGDGYYRVDVSAEGNGLRNQSDPNTDIVIAVEGRNPTYMYGDNTMYKRFLRNMFVNELKKVLPTARISFATYRTANSYSSGWTPHFGFKNLDDAYNLLPDGNHGSGVATTWDTSGGWNSSVAVDYRYWDHVFNGIGNTLDGSSAGRKIALNLSGLGIAVGYDIDNFNTHKGLIKTRIIDKGYEFFSITESLHGTDVNDGRKDMVDELSASGLPRGNLLTILNNRNEVNQPLYLEKNYQDALRGIAKKIGNDSASLEISIPDNVRFVDAINNHDINDHDNSYNLIYDAQTKTIKGDGFTFAHNISPKLKFSYYLRSNTEDGKSQLDVFENVNKTATLTPRVNLNLPIHFNIPQVKVPSIKVDLERRWADDIPISLKTNTKVTLIGKNGKEADSTIYRDGYASFNKVPKFDNDGAGINYTAKEIGLPEELRTTISYRPDGSAENTTGIQGKNGTVILTTVYGPMTLKFKKIWVDAEAEDKQPVTVKLVAKTGANDIALSTLGITETTKTINASDNWMGEFTNLPRYHNGEKITYSVVETGVGGSTIDTGKYDVYYTYGDDQTIINHVVPTLAVVNEKEKTFSLYIKKRDKVEVESITQPITNSSQVDSITPLEAEFELLDGNGQSFEPKKIGTTNTASSKYLVFNDLKAGAYKLHEITPPSGYKALSGDLSFTVGEDGKITGVSPTSMAIAIDANARNEIAIIVKNEKLDKFKIKLMKVDGDKTDLPLIVDKSIRIGIAATADATTAYNGQIATLSAPHSGFYTFDNKGKGFDTGTYYIWEEIAPEGYIGLKEKIPFTLNADGSVTIDSQYANDLEGTGVAASSNVIEIKIKNHKKKVDVEIKKVDTEGNLIKGSYVTAARFEITDQPNGAAINGQAADLLNGVFKFNNKGAGFEPGLYYLREKRAPQGYVKIADNIPFYLKADGSIIIPAKLENDAYVVDATHSAASYIAVTTTQGTGGSRDTITLTITNKSAVYPATGGIGTGAFTLGGILMMLLAMVGYKRLKPFGIDEEVRR